MANTAPPIPAWKGFIDSAGKLSIQGYAWLQQVANGVNSVGAAAMSEAAASDYQADTANSLLALTPETVWSAAGQVALTDASSITVDMSTGFNFSCTIGGNRTLANPSNAKPGQAGCFVITASGGTRTIALGTNYKKTSDLVFPISIASGQTAYIFYWVDTSSRIIVTAALNNPA